MDLSFLFRTASYPYWDRLKRFLGRLFESSIPPSILQVLLSDEFRPRWERAFTHISASPNNYERVEFVGDKLEGAAFAEYIQERFPSVRAEGPLTDFVAYYLSKAFLTILTNKFQFDGIKMMELIWVDANIRGDLRWVFLEDVWEAVVGTLFEVGQIVGPRMINGSCGYQLVANFLRTIFNDVNINPELAKNAFSKTFRLRARALNLHPREISPKDLLAGRTPGGEQRIVYIIVKRSELSADVLAKVVTPDREEALTKIVKRMDRKEGDTSIVAADWAIVGTEITVNAALEKASEEALNAIISMKPNVLKGVTEINRLMIQLQEKVGDFRFKHVDIKDQSLGRYTFLETIYQGQPVYLATYYSKFSDPVETVRIELLKTALDKLRAGR